MLLCRRIVMLLMPRMHAGSLTSNYLSYNCFEMTALVSLIVLVQLVVLAAAGSLRGNGRSIVIPFQYPLFNQCDATWGDDYMGSKTICQVGCLMSSTAMGIAGKGIQIDIAQNISSTPKTLNTWLRANSGYQDNNLIETQVPLINPDRISWPEDAFHKTNDLPFDTVCSYINAGRIVIANVNNGGHFVLLTGYDSEDKDTFHVNDPGYHRDNYSYKTDVVGYRIFDMK